MQTDPTTDTTDGEKLNRLTRSATYASLSVAITLVAAKVLAWQATASVSVLSSLVDSALDVLASGITFVAVWFALSPADSEHRFGHGKTEGLAALFQSLVIMGSALFVCYKAIQRFFDPAPLQQISTGVIVMLISVGLTVALLSYQRYVVRRTGSVAIAADAMHYKSDLLVNLGVAASLLLSTLPSFSIIDPLAGVAIAAYILWGSWKIASDSLGILLDREIDTVERERIQEIAERHQAVKGFHDLRTRSAGSVIFIQFHLEMAPEMTLFQTHVVLDEVEDAIRAEFPRAEIIVHADPLGFPEQRDAFD